MELMKSTHGIQPLERAPERGVPMFTHGPSRLVRAAERCTCRGENVTTGS